MLPYSHSKPTTTPSSISPPLQHGAAVDASDDDGWSPLYIACKGKHEGTARLLLQHGARADKAATDDDKKTPLVMARDKGLGADLIMLMQQQSSGE